MRIQSLALAASCERHLNLGVEMEEQNIADPKNTGEVDGTLEEEFRRTIELPTQPAPSKASHDSEAGTREPAAANGEASDHGNAKSSAEDPWR